MQSAPVTAGVPANALPSQTLFKRDRLTGLTLPATVATVLIITATIRLLAGPGPLWVDETWTGIHALQPTIGQFFREVYVDINAPLYYLLMWGWAALFGVSNEALRAPSLFFGLIAPLLALLPSREIDRPTRLLWCALLAMWVPGLPQSLEARCYPMLLALCVGGTILHGRLIAAPSLGRAAAWASIGALAILTHYYAAILFGLQGLAFLACNRTRALRTWPAALIFLPAFGYMAYHLPQLAAFAQTSWYSTLPPAALPAIVVYAVGPGTVALLLMSPGIKGSFFGVPVRPVGPRLLPWIVGPAALGAILLVVAGLLRPSFTPRYLTIFVPGILLGVAAWAAAIGRSRPWAPMILVGLSLAWIVFWASAIGVGRTRTLNFEAASESLLQDHAEAVVFTWDNPSAQQLPAAKMSELGSFFFRRAEAQITTIGMPLPEGADPNRVLLDAAKGDRPGIIWVYDRSVPGTLALAHPPRIEALDPSWTCRDLGRDAIGVLTCLRAGPKPPGG